jgi:hypothetical protein
MAPSDEIRTPRASAPEVPARGESTEETAVVAAPPSIINITPLSHAVPPISPVQSPDGSTRESAVTSSRLERMLIIPVALLAFLLASFPARNSDIWMHVAKGRLLTQEPFSAGASVNCFWLFDLVCFGLYSAFGGAGLVLCKALLVVGIAVLLLRLCRYGQGWWAPAICTALALMAMSTRLLVQPATISCFFLALTLWILRERPDIRTSRRPSFVPLWPLLALFVLWVNIDVWFVLGLATVALVWLGRVLDAAPWNDGKANRLGSSLLFFLSSLLLLAAACLLNPSFLFHPSSYLQELPAELGWLGSSASRAASLGSEHVTSPFQGAYFARFLWIPAGVAYFPLLSLSLLSFALNFPRWHWQRFLPWLALALLSAFQVRTIPFFAVVAGPVLAWNLQEFIAFQLNSQQRQQMVLRRSVALARVLAVELILLLPILAWPGWLQAPPYEPRRWAVEPPTSVAKGAATTKQWLQEGKLGPEPRGLHLSPETADAFGWYCPEEKAVRNDNLAAAIRGEPEAPADWDDQMRAEGINHVILYDTDRGRLCATMDRLLEDPQQWPLLYVEGYLAVFGWRDPAAAGATDLFLGRQLDLNYLAFHPAEDKKAPHKPSDQEPEAREWWDAFWKPFPPRPIDQEEATLHLFHAQAVRRSAPLGHLAAWESGQSAALVSAAGGWEGPGSLLDARLRLTLIRPRLPDPGSGYGTLPVPDQLAHALQQQFTVRRDDTPPALLYLAIRAARRALAVNPNDAQAYLVLGECYLRLLHDTRERAWWGENLPENLPRLIQLRRAQACAALNQAVSLKPGLDQAHLNLYRLYAEMSSRGMGYLDLALQHLRAYVKLFHEAGPPKGISSEQFQQQEAQYAEELSQLAKEVDKRDNLFEVASSGWKVGDRAMKAWQMGLAGKARDLLLESNVAAFGPMGSAMELELLLRTGRPRDVWKWTGELSPEHKAVLGESYHWLRVQALAASGDYALAREECNQMSPFAASSPHGQTPARVREIMALMVVQRVLHEQSGGGSLPELLLLNYDRFQFRNNVGAFALRMSSDAEETVLRGLLALEVGDIDEAEIAFRVALSYWKSADSATTGGGLEFKGRVVAEGYLELLK